MVVREKGEEDAKSRDGEGNERQENNVRCKNKKNEQKALKPQNLLLERRSVRHRGLTPTHNELQLDRNRQMETGRSKIRMKTAVLQRHELFIGQKPSFIDWK